MENARGEGRGRDLQYIKVSLIPCHATADEDCKISPSVFIAYSCRCVVASLRFLHRVAASITSTKRLTREVDISALLASRLLLRDGVCKLKLINSFDANAEDIISFFPPKLFLFFFMSFCRLHSRYFRIISGREKYIYGEYRTGFPILYHRLRNLYRPGEKKERKYRFLPRRASLAARMRVYIHIYVGGQAGVSPNTASFPGWTNTRCSKFLVYRSSSPLHAFFFSTESRADITLAKLENILLKELMNFFLCHTYE